MAKIPIDCVRQVLSHFGVEPSAVESLGCSGGFSGAELWRVTAGSGIWCLKAWPATVQVEQLRHAHWLMRQARSAGLEYVPAPRNSNDGSGCITSTAHIWDLTSWQPGQADFHRRPSAVRLQAACAALAQLHSVWRPARRTSGAVPAVRRRTLAAEQWLSLVRSGWRPEIEKSAEATIAAWAERAWVVLGYAIRHVPVWLRPWENANLPLQPCLCDLWHDHVLFTDDEITGLVDFGSAKTDHVAVDLARLLGSFVEDDEALRASGLDAYDDRIGLSRDDRALIDVLDRTGVILGLANWLRWLYADGRSFDGDENRVANRMAGLVRRIESW